MLKSVDVIGIGAINYDYMFQCSQNPASFVETDCESDNASEELSWSLAKTEDTIRKLYESSFTKCSTQIGGSALLALRAVNIVCPSLNFGYVGVCGEYNSFDNHYEHEQKDIDKELSFLDNQEWLFRTSDMEDCPDKYIGKASCTLYRGNRNGIGIFPGANNLLKSCIEKKNQTESFSDYLSQARWIHVSSLSDINTWTYIMNYVLQAKEKNQSLRLSIDPGSEFTKLHKNVIQKYLQAADYIFLSPSEKENLSGQSEANEDEAILQIMNYLSHKPVVLVLKYQNKHVLIDCSNGTPYTHYHSVLPQEKLVNDTGAGDFFAGGFIGGLLSDSFSFHQPEPIEIGNIVSVSRMITDNIHDAITIAAAQLEDRKYTLHFIETTISEDDRI